MFAHHVCIQTNNYPASKQFYTEFLDFTIISETENFHGRPYNTWLKAPDGFMIELQTPKAGKVFSSAEKEAAGIAHLCFVVADVEFAVNRFLSAGHDNFRRKNGEIVYEVLGSKLAKVIAPEGTIIELRDVAEL